MMQVKLKLKMEKMGLKVAEISGTLDIDVLVESIAGDIVVEELIDTFKDKGLKGELLVDGQKHSI
ncbi:MAG: hypothetical protein ACLFUI_08170 [Halanaerobiales bacterium]